VGFGVFYGSNGRIGAFERNGRVGMVWVRDEAGAALFMWGMVAALVDDALDI
jgi:hypothetical protein